MPNPEFSLRSCRPLTAITIPQSPYSSTSVCSPASSASLSPSLSPLPSNPSVKRQRAAAGRRHNWDPSAASASDEEHSSNSSSRSEDEDRPHRKGAERMRVSPLTIGLQQVCVKDASPSSASSAASMPAFSLSASSAFLPLSAAGQALSPTAGAVPRPSAFSAPAMQPGAIPPLHPIAMHPHAISAALPAATVGPAAMRFSYPAPVSIPVVPLGPPSHFLYPQLIFPQQQQLVSMPSPVLLSHASCAASPYCFPTQGYYTSAAVSPVPSLSFGQAAAVYPYPASSPALAFPVLPQVAQMSSAATHQPLLPSSSPTASPPWPTAPRAASAVCHRYLLHFPDDASHGAQGGLYQPGKPSQLCITLRLDGQHGQEEEEAEVRLPVKVALKPTVKESATVRRFDELSLHPAAFHCRTADLQREEAAWRTAASVPEPPFLLLRQDWKQPVSVVSIPRWGRQQREARFLSPLHLLPVQDGTLAHTQTRGRGKTEQQRAATSQLYLSLIVDKYYELRCHSGWRIVSLQCRHYKGGAESRLLQLSFSGMDTDTQVEDAIRAVECLSGVEAEGVRRLAKLREGHEAWRQAQDRGGKAKTAGSAAAAAAAGDTAVSEEKEEKVREEKEECKEQPVVLQVKTRDADAVQMLGSLSHQPQQHAMAMAVTL